MFQYDEFQFGDVVGMDPVLCGVTDKILLRPTGGRVAFDGIAASTYEIVLTRKFYDQRIVVFFIEWFCIQASCEDRF